MSDLRFFGGEAEIVGGDERSLRENDRALHPILELAHVAGPGVRLDGRDRIRRELQQRLAVAPAGLLQQEVAISTESDPRSRSGGMVDGDFADAVEEILAEGPLSAIATLRSRWVAAMMRTSTCDQLAPADALDRALLQEAQQLRLQRQRHVADLVQEERAAVGGLDLAERAASPRP